MADEAATEESVDASTVLTGDISTNSENSEASGETPPVDDNGTTDPEGEGTNTEEGGQTPPDTYADFVMPDGIELDEALAAEATPVFKEMGATQEQAQKLMDIAAKQVQASSLKQVDTFNQMLTEWRDQSKNDSEFGGDKFDENIKVAQSAISKYGTPELKQLLEDHGVGNHPEVVRFMVRVGHTLREDVPGNNGSAPQKAKDRVSILYSKDS